MDTTYHNEPALDLTGCEVEPAANYTKKKNVFRLKYVIRILPPSIVQNQLFIIVNFTFFCMPLLGGGQMRVTKGIEYQKCMSVDL